jgi:hypothetical protein
MITKYSAACSKCQDFNQNSMFVSYKLKGMYFNYF